MYEVGSWFIFLIDAAILAILGIIALVMVFIKRSQYAKEAEGMIRAEVQLATGWSEHHVVPCGANDKSVTVGNFVYFLNPRKRRYGKHPMNPFMGLSWLQVPIRIESWARDNPEPIQPSYDTVDGEKVILYDTDEDGNKVVVKNLVATSMQIKAVEDEHTAVATAMEIQEMHAQQKALTDAIANQPNKMAVYVGLGAVVLVSVINLIYMVQLVGLLAG